MPELPEVETIRRGLEKTIINHTINDIEIRLAKQFHGDARLVIGAKVHAVRRYGKGLLIDLDNGYSLAIHVKMTGQLIYRELVTENILPNKHTHVIFSLTVNSQLSQVKKAQLFYNDQRQFGWIKVVKTSEAMNMPFFKSLGPEPLSNLTMKQFSNILHSTKTPIKLVIMDQAKIAGIGNIYANDALYRAKIHPKRAANSLSTDEQQRLFTAIESVLKKGIEVGGASEWHYVDVLGGKGQYQNFFLVYGKDGTPCKQCGTTIERISLGGRGTFFCPDCQQIHN
jgi:formamidopyrimidine-DNA glycosylase